MKLSRICPMCGLVKSIEIPDNMEEYIERYRAREIYIQDMPLPATEREFIKTGLCPECQDVIFAPPEDEAC